MAIYRNVHLTFWSDAKVTDEFTPEDKYFYLYLLTNPHTNLSGCYEISLKQISREMGYTQESIEGLMKRFSEVHNIIIYDKNSKEILLINWSKYNWTKSSKFITALEKEIESIKNERFKKFLRNKLYGIDTVSENEIYPMDTVSSTDRYPMDTTVTVTVSDTVSDSITDTDNKDKNIKKNKNTICKSDYENLFEELWKLYPSKKGKGQVSNAAKKRLFEVGKDEMIRAIERYKTELEKDDWRIPQNGSTFFNSGYIDYLDKNYAPGNAKTKQKKNSFNNFPQREYDFAKLEKQLLKE